MFKGLTPPADELINRAEVPALGSLCTIPHMVRNRSKRLRNAISSEEKDGHFRTPKEKVYL